MFRSKNLFSSLLVLLSLLSATVLSYGQSGVFDRVGIIPGHGSSGSLPEENVDLFTGNVTLKYRDVYLPGPNGLDLEVWRVYNSKILKDRQSGQTPSVQAYHQSWLGIGWTMHMGMVHAYGSDNPVIEFPDGRLEVAYPDNYGVGKYITRDFIRYDKGLPPLIMPKLYWQNGVIWTFGATATITRADGTSDPVRLVTRIENSFGHHIDIVYDSGEPTIHTITDSMGRVINFTSSGTPRKLSQISVQISTTSYRTIIYAVGAFTNGYTRLDSVTLPLLPSTTYSYYDGSSDHYELTGLTTGYGGNLQFSYSDHEFYFSSTCLNSRVLSEKRIVFNAGEQAKAWTYIYPSYSGLTSDTVHVQGPEYNTDVTYSAYDASRPWLIGSILGLQYGDGSFTKIYSWTSQQISDQEWYVLGTDMGPAQGILISSETRARSGDAEIKEEYSYNRTDPRRYGLPTKITNYVNGSSTAKNYQTITYYFENHSNYLNRFMLAYPSVSIMYSAPGEVLKSTETSYYEEDGKWGAIQQLSKKKDGSTYCDWDYSYSGTAAEGPITITINPPGPNGTTATTYAYGVLQKQTYGGLTLFSRTISSYDSSVSSETSRNRATFSFSYDALANMTQITMPDDASDRNNVITQWRKDGENKAVTSQGDNVITRYWDGLGRELGYTEAGDGCTLFYLKTLDAEGRLVAENEGSIDPQNKYFYVRNAEGNITQVTDPCGNATHIQYSGRIRIVTDAEGHSTSYEYHDLPGLATSVTNAQGHSASYTYDGAGRLVTATFNGTRTHTYQYNCYDNVTTETHPETGTISNTYDDAGYKIQKSWGGSVVSCEYTKTYDIESVSIGDGTTNDEVITYGYDGEKMRRTSVTSTKGWSRNNITYDRYGNVTHEEVTIPGLSEKKAISYTYDRNNQPSRTTYPDNNWAKVVSNGLDVPETLAFNDDSNLLVNAASYGPNKAVSMLTYGRNGTAYSVNFNNAGMPNAVALMKDGSGLYDASYTYDGTNKIIGISNTAPSPLNASFGYDSINRIISATYSSGRVNGISYEYDEYDNMETVRENGQTIYSNSYDSNNRIIGGSYDSRGNLLSEGGNIYSWDNINRLSRVTSSSGEVLGNYLYDANGYRLKAVPPLAKMNIDSPEGEIPNGGELDLATVPIGQYTDKTLTIENSGDGNLSLNGSPKVAITGQSANQITVVAEPTSPVLPSANTTFTIRFSPTSSGNKTAMLSISNNDPNNDPYEIELKGIPEINVLGIPSGSTWNFGNVSLGESSTKTFTIQNLGYGDLYLTGNPKVVKSGDKYGQFTVIQQPGATIAGGETTTFDVEYNALRSGTYSAMLSIANNDKDENPYIIVLYGTGVASTAEMNREKQSLVTIVGPSADDSHIGIDGRRNAQFIESDNGINKSRRAPIYKHNDNGLRENLDEEKLEEGRKTINATNLNDNRGASITALGGGSGLGSGTSSSPRSGSYYIYTLDGRLLAEYDVHGTCIRDYIYMGDRLVAEYDPSSANYYYYTQDQIRSTQVITNDSGVVVYGEIHDPFGGIQKTWASSFEPKRKYSDKERDEESGMDYFGMRYYSSASYRWTSPDPVIAFGMNDTNAPAFNLYSLVKNDPLNNSDPYGLYVFVGGDKDQREYVDMIIEWLKGIYPDLAKILKDSGNPSDNITIIFTTDVYRMESTNFLGPNGERKTTIRINPSNFAESDKASWEADEQDRKQPFADLGHELQHTLDYEHFAEHLHSPDVKDYNLTDYESERRAYTMTATVAIEQNWPTCVMLSPRGGSFLLMSNGRTHEYAIRGLIKRTYTWTEKDPGQRYSEKR